MTVMLPQVDDTSPPTRTRQESVRSCRRCCRCQLSGTARSTGRTSTTRARGAEAAAAPGAATALDAAAASRNTLTSPPTGEHGPTTWFGSHGRTGGLVRCCALSQAGDRQSQQPRGIRPGWCRADDPPHRSLHLVDVTDRNVKNRPRQRLVLLDGHVSTFRQCCAVVSARPRGERGHRLAFLLVVRPAPGDRRNPRSEA